MKRFRLFFYFILLLMWKIVNSEVHVIDDEVSDLRFPKETEETDFVDPFSFDYIKADKRMVDRHSQFQRSGGVCGSDHRSRKDLKECQDMLENMEFDKLFSTRLINMILSNVKFGLHSTNEETGDVLSGSLTLAGTRVQIEKLKEFGAGRMTTREVDAILDDMIKPTANTFTDTLTFIDSLRLVLDTYMEFSLAALVTVVVLLYIKFTNWSTGKVVIVFLGFTMFMTFFMTWSRLIKEADLKQMVHAMKYKEPPIQCYPEKMWFWQRIATSFNEHDHCFEYYKSMNFNAFHEVTLNHVTSEVLSGIVLSIVSQMGTSYSLFIDRATANLPFPISWIMTILLYISVPFMLYLMCGGRIRLWAGFFGLSIGGGESNRNHRLLRRIEELERTADGGYRQQVKNTAAPAIDENKLATGDCHSETQTEKPKLEDSRADIEKDDNLVTEPTDSKKETIEKGGGDS